MIEELISRVFRARNVAHLEHWRTGSYAAHVALGAFYADVVPALDTLVEACQARHGVVGEIADAGSKQGAEKLLASDVAWIEKNHDEISKGSPALANLLDGVTEVYLSALYKLRHLS